MTDTKTFEGNLSKHSLNCWACHRKMKLCLMKLLRWPKNNSRKAELCIFCTIKSFLFFRDPFASTCPVPTSVNTFTITSLLYIEVSSGQNVNLATPHLEQSPNKHFFAWYSESQDLLHNIDSQILVMCWNTSWFPKHWPESLLLRQMEHVHWWNFPWCPNLFWRIWLKASLKYTIWIWYTQQQVYRSFNLRTKYGFIVSKALRDNCTLGWVLLNLWYSSTYNIKTWKVRREFFTVSLHYTTISFCTI